MVSITGPGDPITLTLDVDADEAITGEVQIGGRTVALISGTTQDPIVTNAEGVPLTPAELADFADMLTILVEVADVFFNIVNFAIALISL